MFDLIFRNRAVLAFLLFNLLAGVLFVGRALLVSFMRPFGTTPAQLGLILGAGWGASVLGALTGGALADRIGLRRTVLLTTVAVGLFDAAMYSGSALGDGAGGTLWQRWGADASFALAGGAYLLGAVLLALGRRKATR